MEYSTIVYIYIYVGSAEPPLAATWVPWPQGKVMV